jgi:hypothetical protein
MRFTLQLVIHADNDHETTIEDVIGLEKQAERIEHLGLTPTEAKQLLTQVQQRLLAHQVAAFLATHSRCDTCGTPLRTKGQHTRTFRTLFGTVTLPSPRVYHCPYQQSPTTTFRPLTALLTEPRPYDLPCAQIKKSDDLDNICAKINAFWHKRLQCKSYQRPRTTVYGDHMGLPRLLWAHGASPQRRSPGGCETGDQNRAESHARGRPAL